MDPAARVEPFAAKLHFIPRSLRRVQGALVNSQRDYFSHAPGWVLLTTTGRRTGLPRETLMPCTRSENQIIMISTYGWQSDWIRNLRKNPQVKVTRDGVEVSGIAEVVEDRERKRRIISENPFVIPPFAIVRAIASGPLRSVTTASLRRWSLRAQ